MKKRYLVIILVILSIISLNLGVAEMSFRDVIAGDEDARRIFFVSRVPRLFSIIMAGMGMSICGLIMQQISRNKFVSPTTGATLDGAQLGIMMAMVFVPTAGIAMQIGIAFIFSIGATLLFMLILKQIKFKDVVFVPLVGIMLGNVISSITTFIGYKEGLLQNMTAFMQGNFSMIVKGQYELLFITVPLVILAYVYANKFTVAGMGEDFATNLGLNYKRVVNIGLAIVSLVSVSVVLTAGRIPFIGLIVPNIVKLYMGDNIRESIWHTGLFGAIFVLVCDIFSRAIIYPYEISIGLTVGVIGSAIFLALLLRRNAHAA